MFNMHLLFVSVDENFDILQSLSDCLKSFSFLNTVETPIVYV